MVWLFIVSEAVQSLPLIININKICDQNHLFSVPKDERELKSLVLSALLYRLYKDFQCFILVTVNITGLDQQ